MTHSESSRPDSSQWSRVAIAATALLAFSFLLGGASRSHALRLTLIELAALPLLVLAVQAALRSGRWREHALAVGIAALVAAIPLLQLIPLPPGLWNALPGREEPALALQLAGVAPGWSALSLTPDRTWRAFLALTPPVAMFIVMLTLGRSRPDRLIWICLIAGAANVVLCALQLATLDPRFYPWSWTDPGLAVGFFANRNHLASLGAGTLPFAAALALSAAPGRSRDQLRLWLGLAYIGAMAVVIAVTQSRAGFVLGGVSLVASLIAAWIGLGGRRPDARMLGLAGVTALAAGVVLIFALAPVLSRFGLALHEGRLENWPLVAEAAQTYLPVGSGIGSFDAVFRSVEPLAMLKPTYFNEAHNEYLQIWLEAGWFGIALIAAFLVWFGRRSFSAWRGGPSGERNLQRAASIAIGLILLHSAVDYPLRTETMAVFFALCCGILEFAGRRREAA